MWDVTRASSLTIQILKKLLARVLCQFQVVLERDEREEKKDPTIGEDLSKHLP